MTKNKTQKNEFRYAGVVDYEPLRRINCPSSKKSPTKDVIYDYRRLILSLSLPTKKEAVIK